MSKVISSIGAAAIVGCTVFSILTAAAAADPLTAAQAANRVGENATVCGVVASTHYASASKGQPTFLNLDAPYPRHIFTVVIWGSDRAKFGTPETSLMAKRVCATGTIQAYRGKAEIIVTDPRQLAVR